MDNQREDEVAEKWSPRAQQRLEEIVQFRRDRHDEGTHRRRNRRHAPSRRGKQGALSWYPDLDLLELEHRLVADEGQNHLMLHALEEEEPATVAKGEENEAEKEVEEAVADRTLPEKKMEFGGDESEVGEGEGRRANRRQGHVIILGSGSSDPPVMDGEEDEGDEGVLKTTVTHEGWLKETKETFMQVKDALGLGFNLNWAGGGTMAQRKTHSTHWLLETSCEVHMLSLSDLGQVVQDSAHAWHVSQLTSNGRAGKALLRPCLRLIVLHSSAEANPWDPGGEQYVTSTNWSLQFKQWDPGIIVIKPHLEGKVSV